MSFNSFLDTKGLVDLVNTINFVGSLFPMGLQHKMIEEKANSLKAIAEKLNPEGIKIIEGIDVFLTPANTIQLNNNLTNLNITKLTDFYNLLDTAKIKSLNDYIKATYSDPAISVFSSFLAATITDSTDMENTLNLINSSNFYELVRVSNLLVYFDTLGILDNTNLNKFTQSLTSKDISDINNDLPTLTSSMPNFSSYSTILNTGNLTGLITPSNLSCSPCLVSFLDQSGLKSDIMSFLDSVINTPDNFFNGQLQGLKNSLLQYNAILDIAYGKLDSFNLITSSLDSLLASLSLAVHDIPLMANCTPVLFLISMLQAFKTLINNILINPLKNQISNLKFNINSGTELINTSDYLKSLIPHIDC